MYIYIYTVYIYDPCPYFQVVSCLDDTNQSTRLVSCKVLQLLFSEKQHWNSGEWIYASISVVFQRFSMYIHVHYVS